jgi:hypothetical protein
MVRIIYRRRFTDTVTNEKFLAYVPVKGWRFRIVSIVVRLLTMHWKELARIGAFSSLFLALFLILLAYNGIITSGYDCLKG